MRIKMMGICVVAIFAMSAVVASAASAATTLTLRTSAGPLAPGAEVKASSSDLIFETSAGNLECSSNILTGTVKNNGAVKDLGSITEEQSTGGESPPGACKTTTPLGPALIAASGFPWPTTFASKGEVQLKGTKKIAFTSTFPGAGGAKCTFEAAKVVAKFPAKKPAKGKSENGGPITITTANQLFKLNTKISNGACPTSGKLSGTFAVTSGGSPVEAEFKS